MNNTLLVVFAVVGFALAQYGVPLPYSHEPAPIEENVNEGPGGLAHPAVVENAYRESQYPAEFQSQQYKNPRIAEALAKESWFTEKEMPVFNRKADEIPREQVFKIFKNAGFIRRR